MLAGCAVTPAPGPSVDALFDDTLFSAPDVAVDPQRVFALDDTMRQYADTRLASRSAWVDPRRALLAALYDRGGLRLSYDDSVTRNASEAFQARAGNCLSLAIMTAAFAERLGLAVTFQQVSVDPTYVRQSGLLVSSGHVNLVLGRLPAGLRPFRDTDDALIVDFLPGTDLARQRSQPIEVPTVMAMYFNNRAAEFLARGRVDDSYWWARAALRQDPSFAAAANTLGVVYLKRQLPVAAEAALRHALVLRPDSHEALSNLAALLRSTGRTEAAQVFEARLAVLQPRAPFVDFELGRQALAAGDAARARELFRRELRTQPFQDEVNFWAAQADWALGDADSAAEHLRTAAEYSHNGATRGRYIAKLELLRSRPSEAGTGMPGARTQ